jgi:hypothetical protein
MVETSTQVNSGQDLPSQPKLQNKKPLILAFLVGLVIVGALVAIYLMGRTSNPTGPSVSKDSPKSVIAKVGNENIYKEDFDYELASYPNVPGVDSKKVVMEKLIEDSIALQEAKKTVPEEIDSNIYNSPGKDYEERIQYLSKQRTEFSLKNSSIQGTIVSVWFFNTKPGPIGYEEGKKLALSKITQVQNDVKNGRITIKEAGEQIKNDATLAQVDPAYRANALIEFNKGADERITFDEGFNSILRNLKPGEVSEVYLAKDKDLTTGEKVDALYMFGQVGAVNAGFDQANYESWIDSLREKYEVVYY